MIVKLGQSLPWKRFSRSRRVVHAMRMIDDFLFETQHGWIQGHKGQWLVELGEGLRCHLDDEAFTRTYRPAKRRER